MELQIAGKVVIVTGGASGIGAAVVEALIAEGAVPAILDRNLPDRTTLDALRARQPGLSARQVELADDASCAAAVAEIRARLGRIDALVNNAGRNDRVGLDAGPEAFRASLDANLVQVYTLAHLCRADLASAKGAIVNVASKVALTGQGGTSAYAAAKGGVLALTREWAAELARDRIRVNAVVPAEVRTPHYDAWLASFDDPEAKRAEITARIPLGARMTEPAEIADAVVFLLSARASHITGQWIFPDGGYTHLDRAISGA